MNVDCERQEQHTWLVSYGTVLVCSSERTAQLAVNTPYADESTASTDECLQFIIAKVAEVNID